MNYIGLIPMNLGQVYPGWFARIIKRIMDIVFSLVVIVLVSPLLVVIAVLIKLDSPGPVIFRQKRIGKNGHPFIIYKFRSMKLSACRRDNYSPTSLSDERITRMGKFLRCVSFDELPQFWNVLKNDMSVVGPRPEMPFIVKNYDGWERKRLIVKPGITGLWQISLDRSRPIHENLQYDFYYIQNMSVLLDSIIILKTIWFAIRKAINFHG